MSFIWISPIHKGHRKDSKRDGGPETVGHRPNGFLGLSLIDRTILFLVILLDKTVSVG